MKAPEFAWLVKGKDKIALRLSSEPGEPLEYFRHAGVWSVLVKKQKGKLIVTDKFLTHLIGLELIECTEEEWKNDNKGYV